MLLRPHVSATLLVALMYLTLNQTDGDGKRAAILKISGTVFVVWLEGFLYISAENKPLIVQQKKQAPFFSKPLMYHPIRARRLQRWRWNLGWPSAIDLSGQGFCVIEKRRWPEAEAVSNIRKKDVSPLKAQCAFQRKHFIQLFINSFSFALRPSLWSFLPLILWCVFKSQLFLQHERFQFPLVWMSFGEVLVLLEKKWCVVFFFYPRNVICAHHSAKTTLKPLRIILLREQILVHQPTS